MLVQVCTVQCMFMVTLGQEADFMSTDNHPLQQKLISITLFLTCGYSGEQ